MTHRFPIKEVAAQAGLGTATVDRVLNGRAHVSPQTRARVAAAIKELEGQEQQLAARGRRLFFDVVIEAPDRFSREVRRASEAVLPSFGPLNLRARFAGQEVMSGPEIAKVLRRIAQRGSNGICLKARDVPIVRETIDELQARGIPVVTLVTDVPTSERIAYAGLDNSQAGRTAAGIIRRELSSGRILATMSNRAFEGEDARWAAFQAALGEGFDLVLARDAAGLNVDTGYAVASAISGQIDGVYSMSGGNRAITSTLSHLKQSPKVYVAHDLDSDNVALLEANQISHVLYHDLAADMSQVFRHLCAFHRAVPPLQGAGPSDIQIVMQSNIPAQFRA